MTPVSVFLYLNGNVKIDTFANIYTILTHTVVLVGLPGDFRSCEFQQTLQVLFTVPFEHVEQFRNLEFDVEKITNIQSTVLSSSEGTAASHLAFK